MPANSEFTTPLPSPSRQAAQRDQADLQDYKADWVQHFEEAKARLQTLLGPRATTLQHVGSTAVPTMVAKPTIDILLITPDLRTLDDCATEMAGIGYKAHGEYGITGRRYFTMANSHSHSLGTSVNLYAFEPGHRHALNLLLLRDYLRSNADARHRYSSIKRALAKEHPANPGAYQAGKQPIFEWLLAKATGRR